MAENNLNLTLHLMSRRKLPSQTWTTWYPRCTWCVKKKQSTFWGKWRKPFIFEVSEKTEDTISQRNIKSNWKYAAQLFERKLFRGIMHALNPSILLSNVNGSIALKFATISRHTSWFLNIWKLSTIRNEFIAIATICRQTRKCVSVTTDYGNF